MSDTAWDGMLRPGVQFQNQLCDLGSGPLSLWTSVKIRELCSLISKDPPSRTVEESMSLSSSTKPPLSTSNFTRPCLAELQETQPAESECLVPGSQSANAPLPVLGHMPMEELSS